METIDVVVEISKMSNEQLNAVARALNDRRKVLRDAEIAKVKNSLQVGDLVEFKASNGRTIKGKVGRILRKNVHVTELGFNTKWKVTASLLKKVESKQAAA